MSGPGIESNSTKKNGTPFAIGVPRLRFTFPSVRLGKDVAKIYILEKCVSVSGNRTRHGPGRTLHPGRLRDELQLPVVRSSPDRLGNPKGGFLKRFVVGVGRARKSKTGAEKPGHAEARRSRCRGGCDSAAEITLEVRAAVVSVKLEAGCHLIFESSDSRPGMNW